MNKKENEPKPAYYAIIPADIRYHPKLTPNAKLMYGEISALCKKEGHCWASNGYFSKLYNKSTVSISKWISSLEKLGFIKVMVDENNNNKRHIFIRDSKGEFPSGALKKSLRGLKEKFKQSSISNKVSKDTYTVFEKKLAKYSKYIEAWNKHPNTTTHKISNTKTIQKLIKYFTLLKSGNFHKVIDLDIDFAKKNDIKRLKGHMTDGDIFTAIENVSKFFLEGYSPQNKSRLARDLPSLIFNPRTGSSLFLAAFFNPPKPIRKKEAQNKYPEAVKKYRALFSDEVIDPNKIIWNVNKIMDWHSKKCKRLGKYLGHTNFSDYINGENFIQTHIDWIRKEIQDMNVHVLDMDTQYWRSFIKWLKDFHSINMEPTKEGMKHIKLSYENEKKFYKQTMASEQITEDMI